MTNRQKKREAIKQNIAERYRKEAETQAYKTYSANFDKAIQKGYEFKEGARQKYNKEEFLANVGMFKTLAPGLAEVIAAEDIILEEQLQTSNDSIDQAIMLWNTKHPELVEEYGIMTREKFRSNESALFRALRAQYPNKEAYDLDMSY